MRALWLLGYFGTFVRCVPNSLCSQDWTGQTGWFFHPGAKNTGCGSRVVCGVEMVLVSLWVFAEPRGTVGITMARAWSSVVEPDCLCCPVSTFRWEMKWAWGLRLGSLVTLGAWMEQEGEREGQQNLRTVQSGRGCLFREENHRPVRITLEEIHGAFPSQEGFVWVEAELAGFWCWDNHCVEGQGFSFIFGKGTRLLVKPSKWHIIWNCALNAIISKMQTCSLFHRDLPGQKDIKGAEQTKAQCLVSSLVLEGALRGVEGKTTHPGSHPFPSLGVHPLSQTSNK